MPNVANPAHDINRDTVTYPMRVENQNTTIRPAASSAGLELRENPSSLPARSGLDRGLEPLFTVRR